MSKGRITNIGDEVKFNHLTLLEIDQSFIGRGGKRKALFLCDCGKTCNKILTQVKYNHVKTCGECGLTTQQASERMKKLNHKHGCFSRDPRLYASYNRMVQRCTNIKDQKYISYGARGIKVCEEWKKDPNTFMDWALKNNYENGLTLDRLDENWHYEPNNCRWTDENGQLESKYNNRMILAWNELKSVLHWTRDLRCKTDIETLKKRLTEGWTTEDAISK